MSTATGPDPEKQDAPTEGVDAGAPGTEPQAGPGSTADTGPGTEPGKKSGGKPDSKPGSKPGGEPVPAGKGEPAEPKPAPRAADDPLRGSRTGGVYAALVAFGLVLIVLVVFVAQNTDPTVVRFLGWEGSFPVAVVVLIAVAGGILMTAAAGTLRILQLRRRTRKGLKQR